MQPLKLQKAERLEVKIIMDNYTDLFLLENHGVMERPQMYDSDAPVAEHGLSMLIKISGGGKETIFFFDASRSVPPFQHNLSAYKVNVDDIDGVILSHGHKDHVGGLKALIDQSSSRLKLICHPDVFLPKRLNIPGKGPQPTMNPLDEKALESSGVEILKNAQASTYFGDLVAATGEVERVTDFEVGFPWGEINKGDLWIADPFLDDQSLIVEMENKGLVVISGCSHSGIINTIKYAQKISGNENVHAVLGGFHLTGALFEPLIAPTIQEMKKINPDHIVPMHCTGWKAINEFANQMPNQFYLNSVGTSYIFNSQ